MTEELHRLLNNSSEYDHYIPELLSPSEILREADVEAIARHLTARAQGYPWHLVFSSTKHGFSLSTLYRRMEEVENSSPVLVVVEDTRGEVSVFLMVFFVGTCGGFKLASPPIIVGFRLVTIYPPPPLGPLLRDGAVVFIPSEGEEERS